MKTFRVVLIAIVIVATFGLASAGPNTRTISVFPHIHKIEAIQVPVVTGVDEEQCVVNVTGGECSAIVDLDHSMINPLCHWQQDETKCVKWHQETASNRCQKECDEYAPDSRKEWGIHCNESLTLDEVFGEYVVTDEEMDCTPASVDIECPECSVQTETTTINVGYEELVTEAFMGDTIHIKGTVWAKDQKMLTYKFMVFKVYPNKTKKLIYGGPRRQAPSGSAVSDEIEYTFTDAGINRIGIRLFKDDGTVGFMWTKVLVQERVE